MIKIIDNKKVDVTQDEWDLYVKITASYENGKDLFKDLFESDDEGLIVFLRPPSAYFSIEVVLFVQNLMIHQHLRRLDKDAKEVISEMRSLIQEFNESKQQCQ